MRSTHPLCVLRRRARAAASVLMAAALVVAIGFLVGPLMSASAQDGDRLVAVGDLVAGTLDSTNYLQAYLLPASAGDIVSIEVSTDNEALNPALVLLSPSGAQFAQDSDPATPTTATLTDMELGTTGTYTILVLRGSGSDASGTFAMRISGIQQVGGQMVTLTEGGLSFEVAWQAAVNFNLEVRDPVGGTVHAFNPGSPSGGTLDADINGNCAAATANSPTEKIGWPVGQVPAGSYEIIIYYRDACDVGGPQLFELSVGANGDDPQIITGTLNPGQTYLARLILQPTGNWSLENGGVNAGLNVTLLSNEIAAAEPIALGSSVFNTITNTRPAQAFTFNGTSGTTVTITQDAQSGSLDAYLVLLGPDGQPVASNDDAGEDSTDAAIERTLTADGTYTIIATRYGLTIGGTEGEYTLTVAAASPAVEAVPGEVTQTPAVAADNLPNGVIEVRLTWLTNADLQLLVRDPVGDAVFDDTPLITSGGTLAEAGNVNCVDTVTNPVSYIYWPNQLQPGTYEVEVWYQNSCNDTRPVNFGLEINVLDQQVFTATEPIAFNGRYMVTFTVGQDRSVTAGDAGFFDMQNPATLNYQSQLPFAQPLAYGSQAPGSITADQRFQVYSFQGDLGDAVRIAMTATSGTLDPALYLVYQEGTANPLTIAFNDDVEPGVNANSLIEVDPLPSTGTYYIIATHYGLTFGGTTGTFNLALAQQ